MLNPQIEMGRSVSWASADQPGASAEKSSRDRGPSRSWPPARGTFTGSLANGEKAIEVKLEDGTTRTITGDNVIIAAGATTRLVPGVELSENVVTYEEQILDPNLPRSVVIGGSGAIGVEFAYVMKSFGVDVTIVEFFDYACAYCKAAEPRLAAAVRADPNVRLVLKEFPILTPESMIATRVQRVSASFMWCEV